MATSTIKYYGDTAWSSGPTAASEPIKYRLCNGFVTLTAQYSNQITLNNTEVVALTLPAAYRPSTSIMFNISNRGSSVQGAFGYVNASGEIRLRSPLGEMGYYQFSVTYPVN